MVKEPLPTDLLNVKWLFMQPGNWLAKKFEDHRNYWIQSYL